MTIEISFDRYQHNWYVGELYHKFYEYLIEKYGNDIIFTPISELANRFGHPIDPHSLSIFSIYNLIVTNKKTNKTFIHSLSDYAPAMMDDNSGILNFDVESFSCSSNLDEDTIKKYSSKYNILPSFYILEHLSDIDFIEQNKILPNRVNKIYFNGLCYGERETYKKILESNDYFIFKNKSNPSDFLNKSEYFNEISKYNFGLSINGAAKICYRDVEYFGLGILCLREPLKIITKEPLINGEHYVELLDDDIRSKLYIESEYQYINEKITSKINDIIKYKDYSDIINNSRKWYENNCLPINQIKILEFFLKDCKIID
jgi:hypothetical protein